MKAIRLRARQMNLSRHVLAQNDSVFENFFKWTRFVDLFSDDRLDPVENFLLLLFFATLERENQLHNVQIKIKRKNM